jgi:hypothetical protein
MHRAVLLVVTLAMLVATGTAVAEDGFYMGLGLAGGGQTVLHPYWYGPDTYDEDPAYQFWWLADTNAGLFDYTEMSFGYRTGAMAGELSFGYSHTKWFEEWDNETRADNEWTENVNRYTLGLTGLYTMIEPDPIELDLGLRFQLHAVKYDEEQTGTNEYQWKESISGWSFGPVIRARWYLGDGAFALGPEIYPNYTSYSYEEGYETDEQLYEADITQMNVQYSVKAEFFF